MAILVDLTGQTFGEWTVGNRFRSERKGHVYWTCTCSCGIIKRVNAGDLKSGRSTKCTGCKGKGLRGAHHPINPVFSHIRGNAKKRKIPFEIDKYYAHEIFLTQKGRCALTGLLLKIERSHDETYYSSCTASLDRIDSSLGYIVGNVQWVYKPLNNMKWKLTQSEFIRLCKLVAATN